jgi:hypothetical protein
MSPALAFGWLVWTRHRLGLTLCAAYWLLMVILAHTLPKGSSPSFFVPLNAMLGGAVFAYLFSSLSMGLDARLERRESGFPARLFALPLRTQSLVAWPMLWGTSVLGLAWLTLSWGVLRPRGLDLGVMSWWPALLLAVTLAWVQALVWLPIPLPGLRLFLISPLLALVLGVPQYLFIALEDGTAIAFTVLLAELPAAYLTAVWGVSRARRGDAPHWTWPGWAAWSRWTTVTTVRPPFVSPAAAQRWFEGRRSRIGFGAVIAGVALIWLPMVPWMAEFFDKAAQGGLHVVPPWLLSTFGGLWLSVAGLLFLPPMLASLTGVELGNLPGRNRTQSLGAFLATRPISVAELVRAKFEAAALTTLVGWAILFLAVLVWLALSGRAAGMMSTFEAARRSSPPATFWGALVLLIVGAILLTWLQMIQGLWAGLVGKTWRTVGAVLALVALIALTMFGQYLRNSPQLWQTMADALPWLAGGFIALKTLLAAWSLRTVVRRGLLPPRVLAAALGVWIILAAVMFGVLCWLLPSSPTSLWAIVLGIVLFLPLTRLALAPLLLDANRHR